MRSTIGNMMNSVFRKLDSNVCVKCNGMGMVGNMGIVMPCAKCNGSGMVRVV